MAFFGYTRWRTILILIVLSTVTCLLITFSGTARRDQEHYQDRLALDVQAASKRSDVYALHGFNYGASDIIIYNRVPKTASTSFMDMTYSLCGENGFSAIHVNITKNSHVMNLGDQVRFVRNVSTWVEKKPVIYHGHFGFLDFTRFGYRNPVYINIVREPLDRLISYYYFLRYGDDFRPKLQRKKMGNTETFDECVQRSGNDCGPKQLWLQIPFFCGQNAECRNPGSRWALEQAKRNLLDHYLVVGVTEQLLDFIKVLEETLPNFFKGAVSRHRFGIQFYLLPYYNRYSLYSQNCSIFPDITRFRFRSHVRRTKLKIPPQTDTVKTIQDSIEWKLEHEFYEFAKQQFNFVLKSFLVDNNDASSGAQEQQFHYEKIRP